MGIIHIFDLDNTLIYTDSLNNESYNYALHVIGLKSINGHKRVTRDIVKLYYPDLDNRQKSRLFELKQKYFIENVGKTVPNEGLFQILKQQPVQNCVLWTKADLKRVVALLEYYSINNSFREIMISNKTNLKNDIRPLTELLECNYDNLIFYEDNSDLIADMMKLGLNVITV